MSSINKVANQRSRLTKNSMYVDVQEMIKNQAVYRDETWYDIAVDFFVIFCINCLDNLGSSDLTELEDKWIKDGWKYFKSTDAKPAHFVCSKCVKGVTNEQN